MNRIDNIHISALVYFVSNEVVSSFFSHLAYAGGDLKQDYSSGIEWFSTKITDDIRSEWKNLKTSDDAESNMEEMYNAARHHLVGMLGLRGGTFEVAPGDVQPFTEQRIGQTKAWDAWVEYMQGHDAWEDDE